MKQYLPFFKDYRKALIISTLLVMADVVFEIVQPELMSRIVDRGIQTRDIHYILWTGGVMVFLSLLAIVANTGNIYYSSVASVGFVTGLRKSLFKKILQFSFSNIDRFSSASLTTRMTNDAGTLQEVVMMSLRLLIRSPLMLVSAVIIAIYINRSLASIIAVAIPVLALSIFFILRKGIPLFIRMQEKMDGVNGAVQENLMNARVVKSFVREDFEKGKFAFSNDDLRKIAVRASGTVVMVMPIMQLVMNISIVAILWLGGGKIMAGSLQVGELMSFISYITQILMALMMLSMTIMTFSRASASSRRVLEVLNTEVDITDSPAAVSKDLRISRGKITFNNVFFKYHAEGNEFVLKNINLTVQPGETVALIGATGSAKSTLVQLIPRLYDTSSGQVLIDDADVRNYTLENLRSRVGMVLQKNELFSGTIVQNLRWGNPLATDEEIRAAAKSAQADDFIQSFPAGYSTGLGRGGVNVSGGQKQRLCIAMALLKKPKILILDDSTSAVDTATEARLREAFRTQLKGTTLIIIAQRISSIQSADRIVLLDDGAISAIGTHDELMTTSQAYQEIYYSQQPKETTPL
jgi:ATP-binding cassette, subfamily B, multidrug efflux pump